MLETILILSLITNVVFLLYVRWLLKIIEQYHLDIDNINGFVNFYSSGSNTLQNTNNLRSTIANNIEYNSVDYFSKNGFKNKFEASLEKYFSIY